MGLLRISIAKLPIKQYRLKEKLNLDVKKRRKFLKDQINKRKDKYRLLRAPFDNFRYYIQNNLIILIWFGECN